MRNTKETLQRDASDDEGAIVESEIFPKADGVDLVGRTISGGAILYARPELNPLSTLPSPQSTALVQLLSLIKMVTTVKCLLSRAMHA